MLSGGTTLKADQRCNPADGFGERLGGDVTREQIWQGIFGWFRADASQPLEAHALSQGFGTSRDSIANPLRHALRMNDLESSLGGDEMLEFLAADLDPIPADPVFRDTLREQLWRLVQQGIATRSKDH